MSAADHVFGVGHRVHPITKRPLESGIGCLSDELQAHGHLVQIAHEDGQEAADKVREALERHHNPPPEPQPAMTAEHKADDDPNVAATATATAAAAEALISEEIVHG